MSDPQTHPTAAVPSPAAGLAGLLWPGLGLLLRGQVAAALLACWAVCHCAALAVCDLAALASRGDPPDAVWATALAAIERGVLRPQSGLVAVLALAIHLASAWSAWHGGDDSAAQP